MTTALPRSLLILGFCCLGMSCGFDEAKVTDVTKPGITKLLLNDPQKEVVSLEIRGVGSIDGAAVVELLLDGNAYRREKLQGPVSFSWGGDWYSREAQIRYIPSNVKGGELTFRYHFGTL